MKVRSVVTSGLNKDERGEWEGREHSIEGNVRELGVAIKGQNEESYNVMVIKVSTNCTLESYR